MSGRITPTLFRTTAFLVIIGYGVNYYMGRKISFPATLPATPNLERFTKAAKIAGLLFTQAAKIAGMLFTQGFAIAITSLADEGVKKSQKRGGVENKTEAKIARFTIDAVICTTTGALLSFFSPFSFRDSMKINLTGLALFFAYQFVKKEPSSTKPKIEKKQPEKPKDSKIETPSQSETNTIILPDELNQNLTEKSIVEDVLPSLILTFNTKEALGEFLEKTRPAMQDKTDFEIYDEVNLTITWKKEVPYTTLSSSQDSASIIDLINEIYKKPS